MENDITWVAFNLSGAAWAVGDEAIELHNCIIYFRFVSDELRFVVANLADWMANSSHPWATYFSLMECCLVALGKRPGVCTVEIGERIRRAFAKLVLRTAGDQENTECGYLQLCTDLEAGIEGATHAMGERRAKWEGIPTEEVGRPDTEERPIDNGARGETGTKEI